MVIAASSRLPSMFSMRVLLAWINCVVLMATKSQHALAQVYCIIKKILIYAATSSVTTILAGRPRLTAPPFNSAFAFNSANRICLALFGFTGRP